MIAFLWTVHHVGPVGLLATSLSEADELWFPVSCRSAEISRRREVVVVADPDDEGGGDGKPSKYELILIV